MFHPIRAAIVDGIIDSAKTLRESIAPLLEDSKITDLDLDNPPSIFVLYVCIFSFFLIIQKRLVRHFVRSNPIDKRGGNEILNRTCRQK